MRLSNAVIALLLTFFVVAKTNADIIAMSFSLPQDPVVSDAFVNGVDGFEFTPNADIFVTALGWYDHGGDGLVNSHPVGIYNSATQLLVAPSVSITNVSSLDSSTNFRFESVPVFRLLAGVSYTLAGYGGGPVFDEYVNSPVGGIIFGAEINLIAARSAQTSGLQFPTSASQVNVLQNIYSGPTFTYVTAVPEPGFVGMLSIVFTALISYRSTMVTRLRLRWGN